MALHPGRDLVSALLTCCTLACAAAVRPAAAADAAWRDTLVVAAPASAERPGPATGAVRTRITLDGRLGARDLADVLGSAAGLQIRRYGAVGASAVPSLRGSAPAQVRLSIDGMPLDDAQTGLVDLARLPLERFAAVDIHRGGVPVRLGGVGGAGAIDLRTRRAAAGLDVSVGAGSFGELSGRALWGAGEGERGLLALAHGRRADNDFSYTDHRWTFYDPADDVRAVRENAWLREHGAFVQGRAPLGADLALRGWAGFLRRDGGRPGPIGDFASPHASVRYERLDGHLALGWRADLLRLELSGARGDERLEDPVGEVGFQPAGVSESCSEDATVRLSWAPRLPLGDAADLALDLGGERRGQWFRQTVVELVEPLRHRTQTTLFAAAELALAGPRLRVAPSLRWQENVDDFPPVPPLPWLPEPDGVRHVRADWAPALGLVWEARPGVLAVEGHLARSVRVPTWVELFGHRGGIAGNRELQPEEIGSADLGLTLRPRAGLSVRLAAFVSRTDSTIVFIENSQTTSRAENIGATRNRGLELEVWWRLPGLLRLQANATWQRPRDAGGSGAYDGKALPFLPDREAFLRLQRDGGALAPWGELQAMSTNYRDRFNTDLDRVPARAVVNLGLDWEPHGPGGHLVLAVAVLNLTDDENYDVQGYPLPGRSWRASVRYRP